MVFTSKRFPKRYKKYKKTYKKYKKSQKKDTTISLVRPKYEGPFPTSVITKLRFCEYKRIDPAEGGGLAYWVVRANGIYDPDVAIGRHQPLGRDQWALCYYHYTVIGSKCTVEFNGLNDAPNYVPCVCGVYLSGVSTPIGSDWTALVEQGHSKSIVVQGSASAQNPRTVTSKFSAKSSLM